MINGFLSGLSAWYYFLSRLYKKHNYADSLGTKPFFVSSSLRRKQGIAYSIGGSQINLKIGVLVYTQFSVTGFRTVISAIRESLTLNYRLSKHCIFWSDRIWDMGFPFYWGIFPTTHTKSIINERLYWGRESRLVTAVTFDISLGEILAYRHDRWHHEINDVYAVYVIDFVLSLVGCDVWTHLYYYFAFFNSFKCYRYFHRESKFI